jgi:6-phosphogluconate dehydrogenase
MQIGMIGLGRMGMNMSVRLIRGGHRVVAHDSSGQRLREAKKAGAEAAATLQALVKGLSRPRIVWLMIPAGKPVDETIGRLSGMLDRGDIVIDGGNGYYRDDIRRYAELAGLGLHYLDMGVSGGIWGLENGYCMMAGGDRKIFRKVEPILKSLAPEKGYLYCGPAGAGHFVKMVHNAIEYGMMAAYGEGFDILHASPYAEGMDLAKVAGLWNRGSVIRSWLLELAERALERDHDLEGIRGYVEDSGEGRWTVQEAVSLGVSAPVTALSLFNRFRSREEDSFSDRIIAALRNEFGGHAVKSVKKAAAKKTEVRRKRP